jgi:4-hydroxyphenylacetate 3-monooxygenase
MKSGADYLAGLRDGRVVFVGGAQIDDVTTDPRFARAARTIADLYDAKAAPEQQALTYEADGKRHSAYYKPARTRDDLKQRYATHKFIADRSFGLLGRSPDYVSSFITGMAMLPEVFGEYGPNVVSYYRHMRDNDVFAAHAIVAPQGSRDPAFYQRTSLPTPGCRVVREESDGVVVSGMKLLATGAIIANEILIGNIIPLAPENKSEAVTFAVPCNAKGLSLWSRKPLEPTATSEFDSPLTWRFDETDAICIFDEVKIPWERVFVKDDPELSRGLYIRTPAHVYGNHQSGIRFLSKFQLILGLANCVTKANGADQIPAVREVLGRLASWEASLEAMLMGQIEAYEEWPNGLISCNRRFMYASMNWCSENYSAIIDTLRELSGGGALQMPADESILQNDATRAIFERYWQTPHSDAVSRFKLFKLAWDIVGSEFAGRHLQYEKFFGGASFIVRGHSYREAPWDQFTGIVDSLMASYETPHAPASVADGLSP